MDDADHGRDLRIYKGGLSPIKHHPNLKQSSHSPEKATNNIKSVSQYSVVEEKPKQEESKKTKQEPPKVIKIQEPVKEVKK